MILFMRIAPDSTTLPSSWAGSSKPWRNDQELRATDSPGELHPEFYCLIKRGIGFAAVFELAVYLLTAAAPARASPLPDNQR
jgi:hypothetical protein